MKPSPKLPVLFMTGAGLEDSECLAEITRNKLVLRKPFPPKELIDFIDSSFLLRSQAQICGDANRPMEGYSM
jgi:hypothetical protein